MFTQKPSISITKTIAWLFYKLFCNGCSLLVYISLFICIYILYIYIYIYMGPYIYIYIFLWESIAIQGSGLAIWGSTDFFFGTLRPS